jgi:hypothetical protein
LGRVIKIPDTAMQISGNTWISERFLGLEQVGVSSFLIPILDLKFSDPCIRCQQDRERDWASKVPLTTWLTLPQDGG